MNQHLLSPENALLRKEWDSINRHAWRLRKVTGGALRLALIMSVEEGLREDVMERVQFLQRKHNMMKVSDDPQYS